jgi:hypothetical protein
LMIRFWKNAQESVVWLAKQWSLKAPYIWTQTVEHPQSTEYPQTRLHWASTDCTDWRASTHCTDSIHRLWSIQIVIMVDLWIFTWPSIYHYSISLFYISLCLAAFVVQCSSASSVFLLRTYVWLHDQRFVSGSVLLWSARLGSRFASGCGQSSFF